MVLTSSFTLAGRVASAEALNSAIDACQTVLHEVRRRVDATVTNTTARAELRQSLRLADSALVTAAKAATAAAAPAATRPAPAASSPAPLQARAEEHSVKGRGGRRTSSDHTHSHQQQHNRHSPAASAAAAAAVAVGQARASPTSQAPPLPAQEENVTRPAVPSPTHRDGQQAAEAVQGGSGGGSGGGGWGEPMGTNASFSRATERPMGESATPSPAAATWPTQLSTAETCFPLCTPSQTSALYGLVLSAVYWHRRKLTESAVAALEALLRAVVIPQELATTVIIDPSQLNSDGGSGGNSGGTGDRKSRRSGGGVGNHSHRRSGRVLLSIGTAVFYTLCECLTQSFAEPAMQTRALRLLNALIGESAAGIAAAGLSDAVAAGTARLSGLLFHPAGAVEDSFRGNAAVRTVEACYAVAVDAAAEAVRHQARLVLRTSVRHIVYAFVTMQTYGEPNTTTAADAAETTGGGDTGNAGGLHATFATDTVLADYTVDVDHSEPFTAVHIVPAGSAAAMSPNKQCTGGFPLVPSATAPGAGVGQSSPRRVDTAHDSMVTAAQLGGSPAALGDAPTAAPTPLPSSLSATHNTDAADAVRDATHLSHNSESGTHEGVVSSTSFSQQQQQQQSSSPTLAASGSGGLNATFANQQIDLSGDSAGHGASLSGSRNIADHSFNPHLLFCSSIDDALVTDALSALNNTDGALPSALKDLLMLLRRMCRYAVRPCSGALSDSNGDVRARDLSLWVLECTFEGVPVANCEQEHRCAVWMSLVMHACKYELLGCLCRNLAVPAPFSFFERAVHLLEMLLRKLHYHLARELHTLLGAFLLPLMVSRYAAFRQKHAVLAMIRQLFAVPHLCVSFFINYDCNPAFDAGAEYGGMLELLVEHVVEMTFLDHVSEDGDAYPWLTSDQQQLLRSECVVVIHTLMHSLHRWIAEDPQEYAETLRRTVHRAAERQQRQHQQPATAAAAAAGGAAHVPEAAHSSRDATVDEAAELYLDNWEADEVAGPPQLQHASSSRVDGAVDSDGCGGPSPLSPGANALHTRNLTIVLDAASGLAVPHWGKHRNIEYHWKHVHYLLHDKRIAQEAVQRINAGKWQDAKTFLESRGYMAAIAPAAEEASDPGAVPPGGSSYRLFARFLFEYPGVSRDSLSKIFERVNRKDGASRLVLTEYLHCFQYVDVPIDVAMRDTTCKFMSWDRPMFESKVWETIQKAFGAEYARQNPNAITADDADTMAGVLLFLHSNLHNQIVKDSRMPASQFVRDANDCLSFPLMEEDLQAMYTRVLSRKWELDLYGRTPQQAERERTLVRLSQKIHMGHAAQWRRQSGGSFRGNNNNNNSIVYGGGGVPPSPPSSATTATAAAAAAAVVSSSAVLTPPPPSMQLAHSPSSKDPTSGDVESAVLEETLRGAETESASCHSSFAASRSPVSAGAAAPAAAAVNPNASMDATSFQMWLSNDVALLDSTIPAYTESKDTLKFKEEQHHAYLEASGVYLTKLESVHRLYCIEGEAYRPQPYIVPYYAEHVRQMLLMTYPHVMSCVYMGFRILEEAPIARKLLDTMQVTYDIAAAFVLNLRDLRPVMEEALQRYLDDERAYKLLPPSRATFVPLSMNLL